MGCQKFHMMLDERWLQPKVPVLIMCCVPNATLTSLSSLKVADTLKLRQLSRPWQVRLRINYTLDENSFWTLEISAAPL